MEILRYFQADRFLILSNKAKFIINKVSKPALESVLIFGINYALPKGWQRGGALF
jgi:hypothetical protein